MPSQAQPDPASLPASPTLAAPPLLSAPLAMTVPAGVRDKIDKLKRQQTKSLPLSRMPPPTGAGSAPSSRPQQNGDPSPSSSAQSIRAPPQPGTSVGSSSSGPIKPSVSSASIQSGQRFLAQFQASVATGSGSRRKSAPSAPQPPRPIQPRRSSKNTGSNSDDIEIVRVVKPGRPREDDSEARSKKRRRKAKDDAGPAAPEPPAVTVPEDVTLATCSQCSAVNTAAQTELEHRRRKNDGVQAANRTLQAAATTLRAELKEFGGETPGSVMAVKAHMSHLQSLYRHLASVSNLPTPFVSITAAEVEAYQAERLRANSRLAVLEPLQAENEQLKRELADLRTAAIEAPNADPAAQTQISQLKDVIHSVSRSNADLVKERDALKVECEERRAAADYFWKASESWSKAIKFFVAENAFCEKYGEIAPPEVAEPAPGLTVDELWADNKSLVAANATLMAENAKAAAGEAEREALEERVAELEAALRAGSASGTADSPAAQDMSASPVGVPSPPIPGGRLPSTSPAALSEASAAAPAVSPAPTVTPLPPADDPSLAGYKTSWFRTELLATIGAAAEKHITAQRAPPAPPAEDGSAPALTADEVVHFKTEFWPFLAKELGKRIIPLESDGEKAELEDKIKTMTAAWTTLQANHNVLVATHTKLEVAHASLQLAAAADAERANTAEAERKAAVASSSRVQAARESSVKQIETLQGKVASLETQVEQGRAALKIKADACAMLEKERPKLLREAQSAVGARAGHQMALDEADKEVKRLKTALADAEKLSGDAATLKTALEAAEKSTADATAEVTWLKALSDGHDDLRPRFQTLLAEHDALKAKHAKHLASCDGETEDLSEVLLATRGQLEVARERVTALDVQLEDLRKRYTSRCDAFDRVCEQEKVSCDRISALQRQLELADKRAGEASEPETALIKRLRTDYERERTERDAARASQAAVKRELETSRASEARLKASLDEELRRLEEHEAMVELATSTIAQHETMLAEMRAEVDAAVKARGAAEAKAAVLEEQFKTASSELVAVQSRVLELETVLSGQQRSVADNGPLQEIEAQRDSALAEAKATRTQLEAARQHAAVQLQEAVIKTEEAVRELSTARSRIHELEAQSTMLSVYGSSHGSPHSYSPSSPVPADTRQQAAQFNHLLQNYNRLRAHLASLEADYAERVAYERQRGVEERSRLQAENKMFLDAVHAADMAKQNIQSDLDSLKTDYDYAKRELARLRQRSPPPDDPFAPPAHRLARNGNAYPISIQDSYRPSPSPAPRFEDSYRPSTLAIPQYRAIDSYTPMPSAQFSLKPQLQLPTPVSAPASATSSSAVSLPVPHQSGHVEEVQLAPATSEVGATPLLPAPAPVRAPGAASIAPVAALEAIAAPVSAPAASEVVTAEVAPVLATPPAATAVPPVPATAIPPVPAPAVPPVPATPAGAPTRPTTAPPPAVQSEADMEIEPPTPVELPLEATPPPPKECTPVRKAATPPPPIVTDVSKQQSRTERPATPPFDSPVVPALPLTPAFDASPEEAAESTGLGLRVARPPTPPYSLAPTSPIKLATRQRAPPASAPAPAAPSLLARISETPLTVTASPFTERISATSLAERVSHAPSQEGSLLERMTEASAAKSAIENGEAEPPRSTISLLNRLTTPAEPKTTLPSSTLPPKPSFHASMDDHDRRGRSRSRSPDRCHDGRYSRSPQSPRDSYSRGMRDRIDYNDTRPRRSPSPDESESWAAYYSSSRLGHTRGSTGTRGTWNNFPGYKPTDRWYPDRD